MHEGISTFDENILNRRKNDEFCDVFRTQCQQVSGKGIPHRKLPFPELPKMRHMEGV
jgi:hypothetical protein